MGLFDNLFCDPSVMLFTHDKLQYVGLLDPLILRPTTGPPTVLRKNYVSVDVNPLISPFVQGRCSLYRFAEWHPCSPLNPASVTSNKFVNFHH